MDRFSEYRIMWVLVLFDLPTETKKEKKAYSDFRKNLQRDALPCFSSLFMCDIVPAKKMQQYT